MSDYLQLPTAKINTAVSDGTNTFITLVSEFDEPIILKSENQDKLRILISDNLSNL